MKHVFALIIVAFGLTTAGCGPGPLTNPTPTPTAPATVVPTLTPAPTDTPTLAATATASVAATSTQALAPTAVTCPKGTVLRPSVNKCFYATRTPKPEIPFCEQFKKATDCTSNGCSWNKKVGFCS